MMRITVILFCLTICLNGLTAKHLVRRSNECQSEDGASFVCPQADGMFPNRQCTKFWHCSNCNAYEKDCPASLYWNDAKQECDWPQNVPDSDCQPPSGEVSAPTTTAAPKPTSTPAQETTTTQSTSEETTTQSSSDETTTQESNEDTTTQASGEDTTTQGSNEETTTQDSGEETTTQESNDETTTEGSTDATTTEAESTTSADTTTEQSNGGDAEAPCDPPICGNEQYYKHCQCNKFWQCSNGTPIEMSCAPGTAWDDDSKVCNWPSAVNCQLFHK